MDKTLINSEYVKPFQIKIKTRIRKKLLQMISVLILFLTVITTLVILLNKTHAYETCRSKSCIYAANNILRNIDETIDPCIKNIFYFNSLYSLLCLF